MAQINISMYEFLRTYVKKSERDIAVVRGKKKMRFKKLMREIDRVAGGLYTLGIRRGDTVMCALPNIEQGVVFLYAASKLGAVLAPVHPLISVEEFNREVRLQKPKVAVISDVNIFRFSSCLKGIKKIYCPCWAYLYLGLPRGKDFCPYSGSGDLPALYMHSGGTTGKPKTVVLSAESANSLVDALFKTIPYDFGEKDAMLVTLPSFHGFGLIVGIHASLSIGMKAVLLPKFNSKKAVKTIRDNGVTTMIAVPRMLKKLLDEESFCLDNIKTLQNVYVGGDSLDQKLKAEFDKRLKEAGAGAVAQEGYGLTEVGSVCVLSKKDGSAGSVGQVISGVTAQIVDENGNVLKTGEVGELIIATNQCMSGYLGDEKATSDALTEINGVRAIRTGDLFRIDENGNLFFEGRKKRLIKISGMNVFPSEIERVAMEFPFVKACVALEISKEGKTYIKLVIEGKLTSAQTDAVKAAIKEKLSHWHEPKIVECVDALPRTAIGKIDFMRLGNELKKD